MRFQDYVKSVNPSTTTPDQWILHVNGIIVQDPTTGHVYEVNEEKLANESRATMLERYYTAMGAHA